MLDRGYYSVVNAIESELGAKRLLLALWAGVIIQLAGRALDARWHAVHDEFETASDQLQAHWVLWVGALITLAVSSLAVVRASAGRRERTGYAVVLAGSAGYIGAAAWHFLEHLAGNESDPAHAVVAATWTVLLTGALLTTILWRRQQR
jgi:lipopolysaccharide export LptBFGC system permease protein LptF